MKDTVKKAGKHILKTGLLLAVLLLVGMGSGLKAQADVAAGEKLFKQKCQQCHLIKRDYTGPALAGVEGRAPSKEWLYEWIRNSKKLISEKDDRAMELWDQWGPTEMNLFPELENADIDNILAYVKEAEKEDPATATQLDNVSEDETLVSLGNWIRLAVFLIVLLLGSIAIQVARLRGVEFMKGVDMNKLNGWLMLIFYAVGMALALGSINAFKGMFLPESASEHGVEIDRMFDVTMLVVMFVFIVVNAILFVFAWQYRGRKNGKAFFYPENHKLELIWTTVPAIVLTGLVIFGVRTWHTVMVADPPADSYAIQLHGQQFGWNIQYPGVDNKLGDIDLNRISGTNALGVKFEDGKAQDDFIAGDLVLPKGKDVLLHIRSRDVLHSVHLPHFRVKMDAVPGMPTRFHFVPKYTTEEMREIVGNPEFEYELACAEVCGKGHFSMKKIVKVVSAEEYATWLADQSKNNKIYDPELHAIGLSDDANDELGDANTIR